MSGRKVTVAMYRYGNALVIFKHDVVRTMYTANYPAMLFQKFYTILAAHDYSIHLIWCIVKRILDLYHIG